jgi:diguanylate cyclase (GGDEF)-like protein
MLTDCIGKLGKQLSSVDRAEIEDSYNRHLKTKSEYDAAISALTDYHKSLFDETNEFRNQLGLRRVEYLPPDVSATKGDTESASKTKAHPLSNTQVEFSPKQAKPFEKFRKDVIDPADVADKSVLPEYAKDGIHQIEPHITVKYGLHTNNHEDVIPSLKGEKPIEIELGKTSVFKGSEKKIPGTDKPVPYDVVTVAVKSPDLERLNKKLTEGQENTTTFPYSPHVTLAYVKPGMGEKYANRTDFEGQKYTFDGVTFSPADKSGKTVIPLGEAGPKSKPDFYHMGRPAIELAKQGGKTKIQYLDKGKETPTVPSVELAKQKRQNHAEARTEAIERLQNTKLREDSSTYFSPQIRTSGGRLISTADILKESGFEDVPGKLNYIRKIQPEKGFDVTGQTGPEATSAVGRIKEQRDIARREADTDQLTGIANRRALDKALPTAEKDPDTSVISFDANNFGQINKKLGEVEGDKALKEIADAFKKAAEESKTGARLFRRGGDEFVMLAPKDKADAIRSRAEELYGDRTYGDTTVSVSGTVGNTFDEANSQLQAAKATRKSATIPADAQENSESTGAGNNSRKSSASEQTGSGKAQEENRQTKPKGNDLTQEFKPGDRVKNGSYKGTVYRAKSGELKIERSTGQIHPVSDLWTKTPEQIRLDKKAEKEANRERRSGKSGGSLGFRMPDNLGFYSKLEKAVSDRLPNKVIKADALSFIEKNAKAAEIEQTGIRDFINAHDGKIAKADILEYLEANSPELAVIEKTGAQAKYEKDTSSGGSNYREIFVTAPKEAGDWRQGHEGFDDVKNPVVYMRVKDGETADGKSALRVEEIQENNPENEEKMPTAFRKYAKDIGIKYALRYAAENGYDRVTFTTGKTQSERASMSQAVEKIDFERTGDNYDLKLTLPDGGVSEQSVPASEVQTQTGKRLGKLIADRESGTITKDEIKAADIDLSPLYDGILKGGIETQARRIGAEFENTEIKTAEGTEPVYSVKITDAAKAKLGEGQELFMPGQKAETKNLSSPSARKIPPDPLGDEFDDLSDHEAHAKAVSDLELNTADEPQPGYEKSKVPVTDVIKSYENVLNELGRPTPIRSGRVAERNAAGIYKPKAEVVRLKEANNVPVAAHEIFHAVQKVMFGMTKARALKVLPPGAQKELHKLGVDLYGKIRPSGGYATEGFAEFGRYYLASDKAKSLAPEMYKYFTEDFLPTQPEFAKAIEQAKLKTDQYRFQGAANRAKANMVSTGRVDRLTNIVKNIKKGFATQMIDELTPLMRLSREIENISGKDLSPGESPADVAMYLRGGAAAKTHYMVFDGMVDAAGNKIGPPLTDAFGIARGRMEPFVHYLWARRALERWSKGKNPGMSKDDAQFLFDRYDSPQFQLAAQKVYDWNAGVLNYVRGLVPDLAPSIDAILKTSQDYVPLMRAMDDLDGGTLAGKYAGFGGNALSRMTGSGRRVKAIFPQMIANAEKVISMAHKRKVLDTIVRLEDIEGVGSLLEKVPIDQVPMSVPMTRLKSSLENAGADLSKVDLDEAITFFAPAKTPKGQDPIVPVVRDGKMGWYRVPEDLYNALSGLDLYRLPKAVDWFFGAPTRLFRTGTTGLRASFSLVTNPLRDVPTLMMQTRSKNPAKLMANYVYAMTEALNPKRIKGEMGPYLDMFHRLGVNLAQPLGVDEAVTTKTAKIATQGPVRRIVTHPINAIREIFSIPESLPRVAEMKTIANEMGWRPGDPLTFDQSVRLSLVGKQSTVDFSAAGKLGKVFNQAVPFFNASVQGTRSFARAFQRNPARAVVLGLTTITLPTLLSWYRNKDEDWYKEMPDRERMAYWHVPVGDDQLLQIPRSQEWGSAFAAVPEAIADAWYRKDPEGFQHSMGFLFDTAAPPMSPTLLTAAREQWENNIEFFDRPIVPKSEEDLPAKEQYGPYTSTVAKWLGDNLPDTKVAGVQINSPRRIDALIRSVGGGLAGDIASVSNERPSGQREPSDTPVVGRLFRRGGTLGSGDSKTITKFYDELDAARQKQASKVYNESEDDRTYRLQLEDASKALQALRKATADQGQDVRNKALIMQREIAKMVLFGQSPFEPQPPQDNTRQDVADQKQAAERLNRYLPDQDVVQMPPGVMPSLPKEKKKKLPKLPRVSY